MEIYKYYKYLAFTSISFLFFCKFVSKYHFGEAGCRNKKGILFLVMVVNTI